MNLRLALGAMLFYYYVTFHAWATNLGLSTRGVANLEALPTWPVEDIPNWIFLDAFWTRAWLNSLGLLAIVAVLRLIQGSTRGPMIALAFLFVNKLYFYLADLRMVANFHHMHLILSFLLLFAHEKLFFYRLGLGVIYWLAALAKLTPSWLWGEYFNSVPAGLPLLPRAAITPACLALTVLEVVGPVMWTSRDKRVRWTSVALFTLFHAYSGLIVGYWYPTLMLPALLAAFVTFDEPMQAGYRFHKQDLVSWVFLGLLLLGGVWSYVIPGDARTTAEGRYLGMFMFDANRRVQAEFEIVKGDRRWLFQLEHSWPEEEVLDWRTSMICTHGDEVFAVKEPVREDGVVIFNPNMFSHGASRMFGDPYLYRHYGRELLRRFRPDRLSIKLYQQLDGHPERFQVLDISDFEALNPGYNPFWHNDWIRLPGPESPPAYRWP